MTAAKSFVNQNISGHVSMALMSLATTTCQTVLSVARHRTYTRRDIVDYNFGLIKSDFVSMFQSVWKTKIKERKIYKNLHIYSIWIVVGRQIDFAMAVAMPTINLFYCFSLILLSQIVFGVELTFDLPDSSRECFHQEIPKNTSAVLEYQVKWVFRVSFHWIFIAWQNPIEYCERHKCIHNQPIHHYQHKLTFIRIRSMRAVTMNCVTPQSN